MQRLIIGRDGQTRGAILKLATKSGRLTTLHRPVQLLYPLGVAQSETQEDSENVEDTEEPELEEEMNLNLPDVHSEKLHAVRARDRVRT